MTNESKALLGEMSGPKALLWDMDGTLLDSEKLWDIAVAELAERHGITMTPALRESTLGNSMMSALTRILDAAELAPSCRDYASDAAWLTARVATLFDAGIEWRPGARELLDHLCELPIPLVLVTNTERGLTTHALETIGSHRFRHTLCGDEVPAGKPAPDLYLTASALVGCDPWDCLAVEDSPTGAQAAAAAGVPTLVVPSAAYVPEAPGRVFRSSLSDLTADDLRDSWRAAHATLVTREDIR